MTPTLVPVRSRNRLGLDRGLVVFAAMAAVIGILVLKPWWAPDQQSEIALRSPATTATNGLPTLSTGFSPVPVTTEQAISLDELRRRSRAHALAVPLSDPGAVFGTTFDLIRVRAVPEAPASTTLGGDCLGGAMLGDGHESIAVRFDERNVRFVRVVRLFDARPSVRMPLITTETAADGVVLTTALGTAWPVGHYAMAISTGDTESVLPFCIGRKIRLVDYSLIAYLPADVDDPKARAALLAQIAQL